MTSKELQTARKKANLTQEALAKLLGCSVHTVIKWEHGDNPISNISAIAIKTVLKYEKMFSEVAPENTNVRLKVK